MVVSREPGNFLPIYWKLPGGRIEDNETPEEAARREIFEEAGINLDGVDLGKPYEFPMQGSRGPYTQYLFLASVPDELVAEHRRGLVYRTDNEGKRHESTCFPLQALEQMTDFMPKHRKLIESLRQPA